MRFARGGARVNRRLLIAAAAALLLVVLTLGALASSLEETVVESRTPQATDRPATLEEAEAALSSAARALKDGDRDAWRRALPSVGDDARRATRELFQRLSPLPWSAFSVDVQPIEGRPGRFDVHFMGSIRSAGPPDRIVANRVLDLWRDESRTTVIGDPTPATVRRQHLMAFNRPVIVRGKRCLVLADRSWRPRAVQLADASMAAYHRLAVLGLYPSRTTLVIVYGSRDQLERSRGAPFPDDRVKYFSMPATRRADDPWWPRDVGVLAPALADDGDWTPLMLSHELTHAYTMRWFADTVHRPPLLLEGLAVAVEGGRSYEPLRQELAGGNEVLPLATAFATGDLWLGTSLERVRLGYLMGGSLVLYVLDNWNLKKLRAFVRAVADSDLSKRGVDAALRSSLGVGWDEFVGGWSGFVQTLP
jgi:hypothetical protein